MLVQDLKAQTNLISHCEARVQHMLHISSQEHLGIHSNYTFLAFIEKGTQIKGGTGTGFEGTTLPSISL